MKTHRTDGVSLTFGLTFLAIVAWWLVAQIRHLSLPAVGWFLAGALILIGLFGLLGALRSGRSAPEAPEAPEPFGSGVPNRPAEEIAPVTGPPQSGSGPARA